MRQFSPPCHIGAEIALADSTDLLRHAAFAGVMLVGYLRRQYGFFPIEYPGRIWTGGHAKAAAYTTITIDQYDTILALECGIDRANLDTRWLITVHAGSRLPVWSGMIGIHSRGAGLGQRASNKR